ncbi:MAG: hypothetical protein IPK82_44265 [Polyangiaceae bacterium]|nr:hypothetical protein [Polyangiaceae bacterium]
MSDDAWRWFVALDGGDLDGLGGGAGLLRFDWPSKRLVHRFYEGVSGGHNVSIAPGGRHLLLGNFSQQIVLIDAASLEILKRTTTMGIEECDYRFRANTHHLWFDDRNFLCAVGDHLYRFNLDNLDTPVKVGPHRLRTAHELRWTGDRRYILIGDMGPETSGARQVGVFDMQNPTNPSVIKLPGTVWHTCVHPTKNIGYAATYSIFAEDEDYVDWAPAYTREYIFEINLENAKVQRVWSSGAEVPIHLNSDLEFYSGPEGEHLYIAGGGGHRVFEVNLKDFATTRAVLVQPNWFQRFFSFRQRIHNVTGALLRRSIFTATHAILQTLAVTDGRLFDGVYCARVSPDGKYIIAGNRGYNYLRVMERRSLAEVYARRLPTLANGLHLGLHHSEIAPGEST